MYRSTTVFAIMVCLMGASNCQQLQSKWTNGGPGSAVTAATQPRTFGERAGGLDRRHLLGWNAWAGTPAANPSTVLALASGSAAGATADVQGAAKTQGYLWGNNRLLQGVNAWGGRPVAPRGETHGVSDEVEATADLQTVTGKDTGGRRHLSGWNAWGGSAVPLAKTSAADVTSADYDKQTVAVLADAEQGGRRHLLGKSAWGGSPVSLDTTPVAQGVGDISDKQAVAVGDVAKQGGRRHLSGKSAWGGKSIPVIDSAAVENTEANSDVQTAVATVQTGRRQILGRRAWGGSPVPLSKTSIGQDLSAISNNQVVAESILRDTAGRHLLGFSALGPRTSGITGPASGSLTAQVWKFGDAATAESNVKRGK